ncbi:hypothetical protein VCR14J2_410096 [Vibrio coralliirubri]|nr:hypothetical protein VCR15J2_20674 [Vibrio coralliirubri]CDU06581.1 hypothetical protein VCR14J2_410096 [Vibrio coralliirubri]
MSSLHQRLWCNYSINTEDCQENKAEHWSTAFIHLIFKSIEWVAKE